MLRRLFAWTMGLAAHRHARWALAIVSFAESSFFPVPPDVVLVPMVLADRSRAWVLAAICTAASVAGGLAGYAIGVLAFETVGQAILDFYGAGESFQHFSDWYNAWGLAFIFVAGLTPLPSKVFTIASGVTGLALPVFIAGSVVSRGIRFFAEAALLRIFGEPIREFIETYMGLLAIAFVAVLLGGFALVRFVL
ncbi:MAG: DedA family protein [Alphaproteobacteria bacterium]|nr:DedA family protein [Alphaproteobacteria bacterium]